MKIYVIDQGQFNEKDIEIDKDYLKKHKDSVSFPGFDLEGNKIKVFDVTRDSLQPLAEKAVMARFNSLNWTKNKWMTIILVVACLFFALQYTNYKAQNKGLATALEQAQTERAELLKWNIPNKPIATPINTPIEKTKEPVQPVNKNLSPQNQELNYQLGMADLQSQKMALGYKNDIDLLNEKLRLCEEQKGEVRTKTDLEIYKEIQESYTDQKRKELENIVKYEYLDEARKVAVKYCDKINN